MSMTITMTRSKLEVEGKISSRNDEAMPIGYSKNKKQNKARAA